jgi:phosphoribosylformylglycinamidine cyclo-ligase
MSPRSRPTLTYAAAGVDDEAARRFVERIRPMARSTHGPEVLAGVGPFAGMFKLGGYRAPVLVSSTDSVGTKVKIAALTGRFDTIGIDLVNQSVNDILTVGAEPLFFLDYLASSSLSDDAKAALVEGVASACRDAGCALIGGETATLPDVYSGSDFDFVGFVVGVVEQDEIIDGSTIREGDALLALPSTGLHTNGYSLARQVFGVGVGGDPVEERARADAVYEELGSSLADALLAPHRGYTRELRAARSWVKGIAHITGGGALIENVPRMLPEGLGARLDRSAWVVPPIFRLIEREGNISEEEMYRTYNMGLGLVFTVDTSDIEAVRAALPDALRVGEVVRMDGDVRTVVE